ncbi:insulin-like growth factor-binding protein 4 isoform X1 [Terrapene carolina triunguis]|uniref:insulin-like growth factor-binding protein 4 isoform X1 n=1 Tax=Terrapene triunguis TaxID=2587831 RepID=UPI000E773ACB|nr:insulin-like growth factor-binding protein 4 isoform X1 [Terrapene carolina triunguis]
MGAAAARAWDQLPGASPCPASGWCLRLQSRPQRAGRSCKQPAWGSFGLSGVRRPVSHCPRSSPLLAPQTRKFPTGGGRCRPPNTDTDEGETSNGPHGPQALQGLQQGVGLSKHPGGIVPSCRGGGGRLQPSPPPGKGSSRCKVLLVAATWRVSGHGWERGTPACLGGRREGVFFLPRAGIRSTLSVQAQGSCQSELHRALERLAASQTRTHEDLYIIPIPNCDRNGNFHPKQCHPALDGQRGKCWCVDRKTGLKLSGSPELKGDLDCHQPVDGVRE